MMSVQAINGGMMSLNAQQISEDTNKLTGSESFTYALDAAKQLIETTQAADKDVQQKTVDFMTGENDNVVDLLVAQEKSSILLQYSLQVRSGVLSAYKEIMNLSI